MRSMVRHLGLLGVGAGLVLGYAGAAQAGSATAVSRIGQQAVRADRAWAPRAWRVIYWARTRSVRLGPVVAPAKRDAWAVGTYRVGASSVEHPLVLHWNGLRWAQYAVPGMSADYVPTDVGASSPGDVWIFGALDDPLFHWDGAHWTTVAAPPGGDGSGVVLGPQDVWELGGTGCLVSDCTALSHWDGVSWQSSQANSDVDGLASAGTELWLIGHNDNSLTYVHPVVYQWTGTQWLMVPGPYGRRTVDPTIAVSPGGDVWVQSIPPHRGHVILYHLHAGVWNSIVVPYHVPGDGPFALTSWLTYDGHDGVWSGGTAHWTGRRWINAFGVALPLDQPASMNVYIAPIPGTLSTWGIGNGERCAGSPRRCDRDFIAVWGALP